MASNSNSIELTPLWPKNSPNHHHRGWPADHKTKNKPAPPIPTSCPPAVPQKSKNHPPPQPPPLPTTSSKDYMQRKLHNEANLRRVAGHPPTGNYNNDDNETKGPAPQPPNSGQQPVAQTVTSQPLRYLQAVAKTLHTLLVKHYNDLLDRQSSGKGRDKATCFYIRDVFCTLHYRIVVQ